MITISGASDDLIEIDGDIREEFGYRFDGDLLAFSDGTVLRIEYTAPGIWRINPVTLGSALLTVHPASEDDEENYSDRATLKGPVTWVVHGNAIAKR